jgi:hypothetical protein
MAGTHEGGGHSGDMRGAYTGLVVGAVVLFAILFSIVKLTNAHYAAKEHAAQPAAAETSH